MESAAGSELGDGEAQGKVAPLQEELTSSTAISTLDSLNRKIMAAEHKFIQQRVDAAILTVELATLHEPHMRELLALNTQGCSSLSKKFDNYKNLLDQFSQEIRTNFPHSNENLIQDSSTPTLNATSHSPLDSQN